MDVGMLTAACGGWDLDQVIEFASEAGFEALEVAAGPGSPHLDTAKLTKSEATKIRKRIEDAELRISSLACYTNISAADPGAREQARAALESCVKAAPLVGTDIVCCMAGQPAGGMSREETIDKIAAPYYRKLCPKAAKAGVKLAMENWTATNIMNLAQWELIFELVPEANFGLNYDPSHLFWQDIDYLAAVDQFAPRIFHTHAKDTEVRWHARRHLGNQSGGWWRYVIPGLGDINWGVYIARLRRVGYNNVLSIEHEDGALGVEEGFIMGLCHLQQFA